MLVTEAHEYGESAAMKTFLKSAKEHADGGNAFGGLAMLENPSVVPEFLLQSGLNMMDPEAIKFGLKVLTTVRCNWRRNRWHSIWRPGRRCAWS